MATWLKQSTAVDVALGPFLDETDGKTAETGLTISQADVRLKKNSSNWAQKNNASSCSHEESGWYECPLSTTDTDTLGQLVVAVHEGGALPVWREFLVVPANVWDAYLGTDKLEVDVTQVGGSSQSATDLKDFADDGYDPAANKVEGLKTADALTANNDKTGYRLSATGVDDIWDEDVGAAHQTAGSAGKKLDDAGAGATPPTAAQIADAVWDEAGSGHTTPGSFGARLDVAVSTVSGVAGGGALQRTIGVTVGGNPLEGASVWLATDAAGSNVVAGPLTTTSMGIVTVLVDAGAYYVWVQKDGYHAIVAQPVTVS